MGLWAWVAFGLGVTLLIHAAFVAVLDDAILVALVLRLVLRAGGPDLLRETWPGPEASLSLLTRLAY
jgi:hypothetical protein